MSHSPRNAALDGLNGSELRVRFDGAMRQFHNHIYDLRAAFAALPHNDPDRDAGIAITELSDIEFHALQQRINLFATACTAYIAQRPLILVTDAKNPEKVLGIEVWLPAN